MGKKKRSGQGQQQRRGKTINLFEFNSDVTVGANRDVAALPSAPKAAEEWEAEGGRPEYNSRGYKERRVDPYGGDGAGGDRGGFGGGDDFDNRDWTRRGPVDGGDDGDGFGRGGERDWGARRSGPLDAEGGTGGDFGMVRRGPLDAEDGPVRGDVDFGNVRRGPIEAEFGNGGTGGGGVDFGVRKGPIDAVGVVDFGVRKGPVEAEFGNTAAGGGRQVDFTTRKGPIEAEFQQHRNVDFATRKGPVEADFNTTNGTDSSSGRDFGNARKGPLEPIAPAGRDVDFGSVRKGPVESANANSNATERKNVDFGARRKAPLDAPSFGAERKDVDFGAARRGPLQSNNGSNNNNSGSNEGRGRDFGSMRRGSGTTAGVAPPQRGGGAWRRSGGRGGDLAAGVERLSVGSEKQEISGRRDWGNARGAQKKITNSTSTTENGESEKTAAPTETDEWTTVRTTPVRGKAPVRRTS